MLCKVSLSLMTERRPDIDISNTSADTNVPNINKTFSGKHKTTPFLKPRKQTSKPRKTTCETYIVKGQDRQGFDEKYVSEIVVRQKKSYTFYMQFGSASRCFIKCFDFIFYLWYKKDGLWRKDRLLYKLTGHCN